MERWYKKGDALIQEIEAVRLMPEEIAFWFLGQCGFVFRHQGTVVMVDPVLNDILRPDGTSARHYAAPFAPGAVKPDYVLCTHGHIDHLAGETVKGIYDTFPDTRFIIPAGCRTTARSCGLPDDALIFAEDGCDLSLPGLRVQAFSAAHPTHVTDPADPDMALGYCFTLGGVRAVHLGDTFLTERLLQSLEALEAPHILMAPINGDDRFRERKNLIGNMEPEEAAALAVHLGADLSVPTHYDMIKGNNSTPLRFPAKLLELNPAAKWKLPAPGELVIYRKP